MAMLIQSVEASGSSGIGTLSAAAPRDEPAQNELPTFCEVLTRSLATDAPAPAKAAPKVAVPKPARRPAAQDQAEALALVNAVAMPMPASHNRIGKAMTAGRNAVAGNERAALHDSAATATADKPALQRHAVIPGIHGAGKDSPATNANAMPPQGAPVAEPASAVDREPNAIDRQPSEAAPGSPNLMALQTDVPVLRKPPGNASELMLAPQAAAPDAANQPRNAVPVAAGRPATAIGAGQPEFAATAPSAAATALATAFQQDAARVMLQGTLGAPGDRTALQPDIRTTIALTLATAAGTSEESLAVDDRMASGTSARVNADSLSALFARSSGNNVAAPGGAQSAGLSAGDSPAALASPEKMAFKSAGHEGGAADPDWFSANAALAAGSAHATATGPALVHSASDAGMTPMPATLSAEVGSPDWNRALGQQVVRLGTAGHHVTELQLNPPGLGPLKVTLDMNDRQMQLVFVSDHAAVRAAVEAAVPQLRATLADSGISLGNTSVNSGGQPPAAFAQGQGAASQQGAQRSRPLPEPPSPAAQMVTAARRSPHGIGVDTYA